MPEPLLTGDPLDPRFDPPTQEEQDYYAEHFFRATTPVSPQGVTSADPGGNRPGPMAAESWLGAEGRANDLEDAA